MNVDSALSHPVSGRPRHTTTSNSWMKPAIMFSVICFFVILLAATIANRGIYGDGGYLLIMAAKTGTIFHPGMEGSQRICAQDLNQCLMALSLKLGLRNLQTLSLIYSLNQYLVPFLSFAACLRIVRDKRYAIFPILSYLFGTLQIYSAITSESHVMVSLFWPMLFIILDWEKMGTVEAILLPLLALGAVDCYESAMFLSSFLLALLIFQVARNGDIARPYWVLVAVLLAAGIIFAVHGTIKGAGTGNEAGFLTSYKALIKHDDHLYALVILWAFSYWMFRQGRSFFLVWIGALAVFLMAFLFFSLEPHLLAIPANYGFRILLLIVPLGLGIAAAGLKIFKLEHLLENSWMWQGVIFMVAYSVAVQLGCSLQWYGYQQVFKSYLATTHGGIIDFHETPLGQKQVGQQLLAELNWSWVLTSESLILAPGGQVNTLVYAKGFPLYGSFPPDNPPRFPPDFHIEYPYLNNLSSEKK